MRTMRLILLVGCVFIGLAQADLATFSMRYGGVVAVSETTAFYFRWFILDNARTMVDTIWSHFQITEDNGAGYWTHAGATFMSRAEGDDDNFATLNGYAIQQGDTNVCVYDYDSAPGTINHKGFYAVITSKADNTLSPDSARFCSLRVVVRIDTSHFGDYPQLTWRTAKYDTATYDPIQLNYNPIVGYLVYRSADGITGWTKLVPNGSTGIYNAYADTTHIDSTSAGTAYYAVRLVYAPTGRIVAGDTLWILSKLSPNSLPVAIIGIEEQGSAKPVAPVSVNPNPAKGQVIIRIGNANGYLRIYDSSGRLVRALPAAREVIWNGTDDAGLALPSGAYFIKLKSGQAEHTEKIILQR